MSVPDRFFGAAPQTQTDDSGNFREGTPEYAEALRKRQARWDAAEEEQREQYTREHGRPAPTAPAKVQPTPVPPQPQRTQPKLQVSKPQVRQYKPTKAKYARPQKPIAPADFGTINNNILKGAFNTVAGLDHINRGISSYHEHIARHSASHGSDVNNNIVRGMEAYNKRMRDMFG